MNGLAVTKEQTLKKPVDSTLAEISPSLAFQLMNTKRRCYNYFNLLEYNNKVREGSNTEVLSFLLSLK